MRQVCTETVTPVSHRGNNRFLPSRAVEISIGRRVTMPESREHGVRRLRDVIRAAVLGGTYRTGLLPSEAELMAEHSATRATVRDALAMLRAERLIERTQGIGTHAVVAPLRAQMEEALGVLRPANSTLFDPQVRPKVLDRAVLPVPSTLAEWMGVAPGTECVRLDYISLHQDDPIALATNYVLYPEAEKLLNTPFRHDWYSLLDDAGVVLGQSEFVMDSLLADALSSALLNIAEGSALLAMDQTIRDPDGRIFNVAFIRMRPDRFRFVSQASAPTRQHPSPIEESA